MKFSEINISNLVRSFFKEKFDYSTSLDEINEQIRIVSGIRNFFFNISDVSELLGLFDDSFLTIASENKIEYGDFQTNKELAFEITNNLKKEGFFPQIVIEPTCGKGNFILAVLNVFDNVEKVFGIEIQEKYSWQVKFNILDFFLNNLNRKKPEIIIINSSIFGFNYTSIMESIPDKELLIIGNPPWVTNSSLGAINSQNLPPKTNFKQNKGLDSITGKANFDIAESIIIDLLRNFDKCSGKMALLVKNSVIKNIIYSLPKLRLLINGMQKQNIDSRKEFGVNVDASLFLCTLNSETGYICKESDFYSSEIKGYFGWKNNRFMSDISYAEEYDIDGISQLVWRQGVKHDCAKIMEITREGNFYKNKLSESFIIEEDLVFPLLKSSDLKQKKSEYTNRNTIITQKYVGQNTSYIQKFPKTYAYLSNHIDKFRERKSSIYKNKCDFAIFGIGNYSFKPYKIAISGLYKTFHFCFVTPQNAKPVMLDDTCYFIGFDSEEDALFVWKLLNSEIVHNFLKSISFKDSKRMITKEILMRIDLKKIACAMGMDTTRIDDIIKINGEQVSLF